jgi:hypothetical protein
MHFDFSVSTEEFETIKEVETASFQNRRTTEQTLILFCIITPIYGMSCTSMDLV